jgi:hypothetical protein
MFERYTEKARRTIFFARYEASQFGSPEIETEHLLMGLLRENQALAQRVLPSDASVETIRKQIEGHSPPRQKVSTSVDLPLSHECKRVLAYGAEEAERLNHMHIGAEHLLLGLLREEGCFAAQLLRERGITFESAKRQVRQSEPSRAQGESECFARLDRWLAERQARGSIHGIRQRRFGNTTTRFAIYEVPKTDPNETGQPPAPAQELMEIQKRIEAIVERMEHAIANHEFEKARFYSDEERKEREALRLLREQFNLEEPPPRVPILCIEILSDEPFSEVQQRCDAYLADGIAHVWLLDPDRKRAYTVTKAEGLRECRGGILQIANPPLELDLKTIFD